MKHRCPPTGFTGCFALLAAAASSLGASGDGPQWRGPNRDGLSTETGLLKAWPADGPKLLWKANGLGKGVGSLSALANRLYTTSEANALGPHRDEGVECSSP